MLAHGFRQIATEKNLGVDAIAKLVAAPGSDVQALVMALPIDLKKPSDAGTPHALARWFLHRFIARPGFLYDRLHAATLVGLNESGFQKVEKYFDDALYRGVFHSSGRPRWWSSQLKHCLLKAIPEPKLMPPAKRGRLFRELSAKDYSRCYFTDSDLPDVIASPDETSDQGFPAVSEVTAIAQNDTPAIGFQPRRVFVRQREKK